MTCQQVPQKRFFHQCVHQGATSCSAALSLIVASSDLTEEEFDVLRLYDFTAWIVRIADLIKLAVGLPGPFWVGVLHVFPWVPSTSPLPETNMKPEEIVIILLLVC